MDTICAICNQVGDFDVVYNEYLTLESFSTATFSARRLPDRNHYRWVKCRNCELFRSHPITEANLKQLYADSSFDYSRELFALRLTYKNILRKGKKKARAAESILEIGGGNGFFLEDALEMGYREAREIEPSTDAYKKSKPSIQKNFIVDIANERNVGKCQWDAVAIFHVLDHLPNPLDVLRLSHQGLKSGGVLLLAVHNVDALSARIAKNRSPIFDVEHLYLYSPKTIKSLLQKAGFSDVTVYSYWNFYSLSYVLHLVPISRKLKKAILNSKINSLIARIIIPVKLGNMAVIAKK